MVEVLTEVSPLVSHHLKYITYFFVVGMWTLDPIDGTKGFLRGEQYAVDVLRRWIVILKQYASDLSIPSATLLGFAIRDTECATRPPLRRAMRDNDHFVAQVGLAT